MRYKREVCGTCKYNKRDYLNPQDRSEIGFYCGNDESENYGVPTAYDDTCDDYEVKE